MKKKILVGLFFILFFTFGCKDQESITNPEETKMENSFEKQAWSYEGETWPNQTTTDPCGNWTNPDDILSFTNQGYTFQFSVSSYPMSVDNYRVKVKVNGSLITTLTFNDNYHSFTYNGISMNVEVLAYSEFVYNDCVEHLFTYKYPTLAETNVLGYVNPDPVTGSSVTPTMHNNLNQTVSLTWNASTDTDVTGYEIYRIKYYLFNGIVKYIGPELHKTITSRTTTSWQETPYWGERGFGYSYLIYAVDGTHNLKSNASGMGFSYLEDYDEYMP